MKIKRHLMAAAALVASTALVAPAFAHESRTLPRPLRWATISADGRLPCRTRF